MNNICTWFCADEKGEESLFPQTGKSSSSAEHQNIYWRCVLVFFSTSRRFNKNENHIFFTNVKKLPVIDDLDVEKVLSNLKVEVAYTDFKYKTPKGYYGQFQNQFYEFSILEYISKRDSDLSNLYLVVDSDCIFLKPASVLFNEAATKGFLSFKDDVKPDYVINGLSRNDLKSIYEILLNKPLNEAPPYHLGEFLLCSVENIKQVFSDFKTLWPQLLSWNSSGKIKFNEEAHTLSYLYYINNHQPSNRTDLMKRIWTNPVFYRNVEASDANLVLWHLPSEKTFAIKELYDELFNNSLKALSELTDQQFKEHVFKVAGVPDLKIAKRLKYYILSYYRALSKRFAIKFNKSENFKRSGQQVQTI